jgi:hypothetical protein
VHGWASGESLSSWWVWSLAEVRWRQTSPVRDIRDTARDSTIASCMPIGDISQSIARHVFLVLRVPTLPSRAVTQTLRALGRGWMMSRERRGREELKDHGCPNVVCLELAAPMSHDIRLSTNSRRSITSKSISLMVSPLNSPLSNSSPSIQTSCQKTHQPLI